jgi:hypothetical protein
VDKVFFFIELILLFVISRNRGAISQNVNSKLLAWSYFESVHRLTGNLGIFVSCVLNNSMAFVLALNIFWQFDIVDLTEGLEELTYLLFR